MSVKYLAITMNSIKVINCNVMPYAWFYCENTEKVVSDKLFSYYHFAGGVSEKKFPKGVNSGVILMNLTRMRTFRWTDYVELIYKRYKGNIFGDQDIINIIFHYHPDKLYLSPCRYNYRTIHCVSWCHSADKEGAAVLHGIGGDFHKEHQLVFHAIYTAMRVYQLGTDPHRNLYLPIKKFLRIAPSSFNCGKVKHIFSKSLERYFQKFNVR